MAQENNTPAVNDAPEKVITITTPNARLDALTADPAPETPVEEEKPEETPAPAAEKPAEETPAPEVQPEKIRRFDKPAEETPAPAAAGNEEINIYEYSIEVEGKERSVAEVVDEHAALSKRLAEIEKDTFLKGFIDHYLATGNASAYLEAKGVDYDKKDDLELLKSKFDQEYFDLDAKTRDKLWKREIADKYKIKPNLSEEELNSEDYEIAQGLLKRDANKVRGEFKTQQSKFQIVDKKQEEKPAEKPFDPVAYKAQLVQEKEVDSFIKNKLLKLGVKDSTGATLAYEPENVERIIEMMTNDVEFWKTFVNAKDKSVDRVKQAKIYAYAMNPEGFEESLVSLGKTLGLEERLKEEKNTDGRLNKAGQAAAPKQSFAKEFLTAALKKKNI